MATIIHPSADVSEQAVLGEDVKIWHQAQVRERAQIGSGCILSKGVYVDFDVSIGDNCKLQNGVYIYHGAALEEGVFLGPGVILTNDKLPRAINADGSLKGEEDWQTGKILVQRGASIGARSIVLPDVTIGEFALVGAGSVVTRNVPKQGLVYGNPARLQGYVCTCGERLFQEASAAWACTKCSTTFDFAEI